MITLSPVTNSKMIPFSTVYTQNMVTFSTVISYFHIVSLKSFLLMALAFCNKNQLFESYRTLITINLGTFVKQMQYVPNSAIESGFFIRHCFQSK